MAATNSNLQNALASSLALGADGTERQMNEICFELLNAEAVALFLSGVVSEPSAPATSTTTSTAKATAAAPQTQQQQQLQQQKGDADLQNVFNRLEAIGYQVGVRLTERHASNLSRFADQMECVKFICRDLWSLMFKKQADNLKTNHKGTYVLQDLAFRWFVRMSPPSKMTSAETLARARLYTALPTGVIRGALANLGIIATVTVDIPALPQCSFKITVSK